MNLNNSPILDASATQRGAVSTGTQTFAGSKTFASPAGSSSSDICFKLGSSVADGSVNAGAKLLSIGTGIGGTYVEKLSFKPDGFYSGIAGNLSFLSWQYGGFLLTTGQAQENITMVSSYLNIVHDVSTSVQCYTGTVNLFGGNGTGASDVSAKVGTRIADGSVNSGAKLLTVRTGVGATEVEYAYITKPKAFGGVLTIDAKTYTHGGHINFINPGSGYSGLFFGDYQTSLCLVNAAAMRLQGTNRALEFYSNADGYTTGLTYALKMSCDSVPAKDLVEYQHSASHTGNFANYKNSAGTSLARISADGSYVTTGSINFNRNLVDNGTSFPMQIICNNQGGQCDSSATIADAQTLWRFRNFGVDKSWILGSGRFDQAGTDQSATVGAATSNKPTGINTIASGATTCVITNNLIPAVATARIRITIQWHGDHGATRSWVVQTSGGGSFTVTLPTAATANTIFSWSLSGLI